ncbi:MAG: ISKra4 family transposase [Deltaproteobacteria bacterium]|nr:ISKra4 family transposase [Deltaproteobacteria bacterium]
MEAQVARLENPFAAATERFDELLAELSAKEQMRMTHSEAETLINTAGTEVMRLLLQGHVDLRARGEIAGRQLVGADGVTRTQIRVHQRGLMSIFGEVEVARLGYCADGAQSLHPLDAQLNLPLELYSLGVRRRCSEEAARGSFDGAVDALLRSTGARVPKRQLEQVVVRASKDFDGFYEDRRASGAAASLPAGPLLVITTDGKGISMRKEALREATRKAAEQRRPKLGKRLSKGEKRHRKRMSMVASVYTLERFARRPEDIVGELDRRRVVAIRRPRPQSKRVWASVEKPAEDVIAEAFAEAIGRDPEHEKRWVVLVDGNEPQIDHMLRFEKEHCLDLTIVVDLMHVLGYLWKAAWVFHAEGTREAETWVTERLLQVLRGRSSEVAGGIRRSATLRGISAKKRAPADECADYLIKYRVFLRYDEYLADGLPIATGVIEGACRHLVEDRLGLTGAHWGVEGAEAVLKLRALRSSGDFDDYWNFHEKHELERNHRALYANGALPDNGRATRRETSKGRNLRLIPGLSS